MEEQATVFFEVCARNGFAAGTFRIQYRRPQDNVFAVEGPVALADRHCRLPRVIPHGCKPVRLWIEAGDPGTRARGSVSVNKGEIGLQKPAFLDHVLFAGCLAHDWLAICGEKGFHNVPVTHELYEQLLTGSWRVRRLVLIMGLLRNRSSGNEQNC